MKGLLILSLLLGLPAAAAAQDPANVDAAQPPDPLNVSSRPPAARASGASGLSLSSLLGHQAAPRSTRKASSSRGYIGRAEEAMPSLSDEDYRQAYGTSDIRNRLGRVYNAGGSGLDAGSGLSGLGSLSNFGGSWLDRLGSGLGGASSGGMNLESMKQTAQPLQDAMNDLGRQLMPALQDMRNNLDTELNRSNRQR